MLLSNKNIRVIWTALALAVVGCGDVERLSGTDAGHRVVRIAAAADLKFAMDEFLAIFREEHPEIAIDVSYGSSGSLFAQLSNGAPYDLFLSADMDYPRRLIDEGVVLEDSEFRYAMGHLVVWAPKESPLDVERLGLDALTEPSAGSVAIANPQFAPYGRAAEAALRNSGVYKAVQNRLVLGENVAQTAQFVESGAADAGIISLSLALSPALRDKGRFREIPPNLYAPIEQGGVILRWARDREATRRFHAFLVGPTGKEILKRYGFSVPEE